MNHSSTPARPLLLAVAVAATIALSGCGADNDPQASPSEVRTIVAYPYKIDSSVTGAVNFFNNKNVFEGTVVKMLPDVSVIDTMDDGLRFEAVYTPVIMRVDASYSDEITVGSEITVRAMGGEADGLIYVIEAAPAKSTFQVGNKLMIFAGEVSAVESETTPAVTPNFVYQQVGENYVDATYGDGPAIGTAISKIDATQLRAQVASAED
jgi:hypothetical protein